MSDFSPRARYEKLCSDRNPFEYRAQKCAALTIPYLFTRVGTTSSDTFPTPFQSNGANGVNTMASAISLALFPPSLPFFREELDGMVELEIRQIQTAFERAGRPERPLEELSSILAMRERMVLKEFERHNYRVSVHEAARHLLVVGNALLEHLPDGGLRLHPLRSYVTRRNPDSSPAEVVILEQKGKDQLTEEEKAALTGKDWAWAMQSPEEPVSIYTRVEYEGSRYRVEQQLGDVMLDGGEDEGDVDDCPFWPLRFNRTSNEHYGRSYVEEYFGDIASLDTSQQAIVEAAAMAAKVLFMVDPASGINPKTLASAHNGAFRSGRAQDVTTLQVGKQADMSVAFQIWERLSAQVNRAFATPEVRNADRVTAEEIRFLQQQLERSLGGTFPLLAMDLQLPIARQLTRRLERRNAIPKLPAGTAAPVIVTGIQALGRSMDADKLVNLRSAANAAMGPQVAAQHFNDSVWLQRLSAALSVDDQGLIRSSAELAAQAQAQQQQMIQDKVAEGIVSAGGKVLAKATPEGSLSPAAAA